MILEMKIRLSRANCGLASDWCVSALELEVAACEISVPLGDFLHIIFMLLPWQ